MTTPSRSLGIEGAEQWNRVKESMSFIVREAKLVIGECTLFATVRDPVMLTSRGSVASVHVHLFLVS